MLSHLSPSYQFSPADEWLKQSLVSLMTAQISLSSYILFILTPKQSKLLKENVNTMLGCYHVIVILNPKQMTVLATKDSNCMKKNEVDFSQTSTVSELQTFKKPSGNPQGLGDPGGSETWRGVA